MSTTINNVFKIECHEVRDSKEAQQLLIDVIERIEAEIGKIPRNQVHHLNPGSVIDVLA